MGVDRHDELHPRGYLLASEEGRYEKVQELSVSLKYLWPNGAEVVNLKRQIPFAMQHKHLDGGRFKGVSFLTAQVRYVFNVMFVYQRQIGPLTALWWCHDGFHYLGSDWCGSALGCCPTWLLDKIRQLI